MIGWLDAAMANWGTSHAGTGNEKPSVVEARRIWWLLATPFPLC